MVVNNQFIAYSRDSRARTLNRTLLVLLRTQRGTVLVMELRHLRYFVAVAEEQNVSLAAQRLHVSRPPRSRQIRDLEAELGLALFEHSAKAIRLTEAGKIFLLEARAVLQRAEDAVALTKSVANQKRGQVHVGYSMPASGEILPRALRAFQRANPQARVDLHMMPWQRCFAHFAPGIWMFPSRCILSQRIFKD